MGYQSIVSYVEWCKERQLRPCEMKNIFAYKAFREAA